MRKKIVAKKPLVSIVVTTRNSSKTLGSLLLSIQEQTYKHIETIVVDNSSEDKTREVTKQYEVAVFTKGPERSVQRNFGVSKTKGKFVFILDSDMELEEDVVAQCVEQMEKTESGALVIPERSFGEGFWTQVKAFEREFYVGEVNMEAARFFRKNLFVEFGGYDTSITGPEDWDLPLRMKKAGIAIGRISAFINHNEGRFSPWQSAKKKFYYASHAYQYLRKHPEKAFTQGNLLFRPVYLRKWKKLVAHPILGGCMFLVRIMEMTGAALGILYAVISPRRKITNKHIY